MATYEYEDLKTKYNGFLRPMAVVMIDGKDFGENKKNFVISDLEIENTSDFEASIASFVIYNSFNKLTSRFLFSDLKSYILLGSPVVIYMGYEKAAKEVFRGFIARVNFEAPKMGTPGVRVTVMDVKGLMMSGSYARQLLADNYGDAVLEILNRTNYEKMKKEGISSATAGGMAGGIASAANTVNSINSVVGGDAALDQTSIITKITVESTPDKKEDSVKTSGNMGGLGGLGGAGELGSAEEKVTDRTIEMVNESDYEFVVKAAKKFNYEFFTVGGQVYFRKAKSDQDILMVLGPETGMRSMDAQYDITGLVGSVEVRGIDVSKGQLIKSKQKLNNKISTGSKAKGLITDIQHVVIDPTIGATDDAQNRANYLAENISYRFGTLQAEFNGMPELIPGKYIILSVLGLNMDVKFYVTSVIHRMSSGNGYTTRIVAKAASIDTADEGAI